MCPQWMTWWDTGTPRVTGQAHSGLGGAAHFVMVGVSHAVVSPFRPIQLSRAEGHCQAGGEQCALRAGTVDSLNHSSAVSL